MPRIQHALPEATTVNGIGQWILWTRNFRSSMKPLLDLMDNSFDAAICSEDISNQGFRGLIHVYPDTDSKTKNVSGLVILNNSYKHIKPMAQVLEVYQSSKGNKSESIGENGVGLKQGCANLSDLSFVFSKNLGQYSIGILAKSLQRKDACVLPSFSFTNFPTKDELQELFTEHAVVGEYVAYYGGGSLEHGIERLLGHCQSMVELEDRNHVFCVVLHELKHHKDDQGGAVVVDSDSSDDEVSPVDYAQNARALMEKLAQELPRQYIHVSSKLDVQVDGKRIVFAYWQRRLVELSSFQVKIDPKHPITTAADWKDPVNGYDLKVYTGFDPVRVAGSSTTASLYIYSRQSGRLILHEEDGRSRLKLPTGGTDYAQGLTIIVDDYHGALPLNPTKQDLAFGEESHGDTHSSNLYNWLAGIAKVFYGSHLGKFEGKSKTLLTEEIKHHVRTVQEAQRSIVIPRPLPECNLSTIINIPWCLRMGKVVSANGTYRNVTGVDTFISIQVPTGSKQVKKERKQTPKKRKAPSTPPATAKSAAVSSSKRKRAAVCYAYDEEEEEEESPVSRKQKQEKQHEGDTELIEIQDEEIHRLKEDNTKLKKKGKKLKEALRGSLAEVKELREENKTLKEKHSSEHHHRARTTASKSTIGGPSLGVVDQNDGGKEELAAANRRIEELEKALKAANDRAAVAETETEIQQETANDYRKKYAELRNAVKQTSSKEN